MFFIFTQKLGEMIQFDGCICFKWVALKAPPRVGCSASHRAFNESSNPNPSNVHPKFWLFFCRKAMLFFKYTLLELRKYIFKHPLSLQKAGNHYPSVVVGFLLFSFSTLLSSLLFCAVPLLSWFLADSELLGRHVLQKEPLKDKFENKRNKEPSL